MAENATILYRGARYELGRGHGFFGIWPAGVPQAQPFEWWPATPEGWHGAWSRFTGIEAPGDVVQVSQNAAAAPPAAPPLTAPASQDAPLAEGSQVRAVVGAALLALGVLCGVVALFPGYLGGGSLASEPAELVTHAIYLAAWSASAAVILLGPARRRAGALLGIGTSIVTFGFFFADAGTVIAGGAHLAGAGLVLGLIGWLACAAGSVVAFEPKSAGLPRRLHGHDISPVLTMMFATLAAIGVAVAFAPSWDRITLRTAAGLSQSLTEGNAFANPAPVIAGNVAVMVALVLVAVAAAAWRPARLGAALLAGAAIPMVAQAISALVELGEAISPTQFNITPAQAAQVGLKISSGVTPVFWLYCAFLVVLAVTCGWMAGLRRRTRPARPAATAPAAPVMSGSEPA